jgi:hypothetical protein
MSARSGPGPMTPVFAGVPSDPTLMLQPCSLGSAVLAVALVHPGHRPLFSGQDTQEECHVRP